MDLPKIRMKPLNRAGMTMREQVEALEEYVLELERQLRFLLSNLEEDNLSNELAGKLGELLGTKLGEDETANVAAKLLNACTIQTKLDSTDAVAFDGTQSVTPGVTGILPIENGGTGNKKGLAASATKLETARTIQTDLGSTETASFDGTKNVTPGVKGTLPIANGGTEADTEAGARSNLKVNLQTFSDPAQFGASYASTPREFHAALPVGSIFVGIAGSFTDAGWNFPNKTATLEVLKYNGVRSRYLLHLKSGASYWSDVDSDYGYPTGAWHEIYNDKSTIPIANGGTGATEAEKACENLGAVKKSGDTMTGTLKVPELRLQKGTSEYSSINFYAKAGARAGSATMNATDGVRRFVFTQYHNDQDGADTQYYTQYQLPKATAGLTDNAYYELITQKGGAFVGDLSITKETPQLFLRNEEGVLGVIQGLKNNANTNVSMRFAAKGKGTSFYEYFALPYANNNLTAHAYYNLLTTKAAVTIEQGGTGATARKGAFENLAFLGSKPIASLADDTIAKWAALGSGYAWYGASGLLTDQPATYGFVISYTVNGNDVFQIWKTQSSGAMYYRSGNGSSGWSPSWTKLFDETSVIPIANGGTGNTTGLAASATKLANARTIRTNLGSTSAASFDGTGNVTPGVTGTLPIGNGGTGATTAAAARTNLGLNRVTLWSGTAANGASITFTESLDNFSQLAVKIGSNVPSDVIAWTGGTVAMFMRMGYNAENVPLIFSARIEIADDGLSATVVNPWYMAHKASGSHGAAMASSITAVYGWR